MTESKPEEENRKIRRVKDLFDFVNFVGEPYDKRAKLIVQFAEFKEKPSIYSCFVFECQIDVRFCIYSHTKEELFINNKSKYVLIEGAKTNTPPTVEEFEKTARDAISWAENRERSLDDKYNIVKLHCKNANVIIHTKNGKYGSYLSTSRKYKMQQEIDNFVYHIWIDV